MKKIFMMALVAMTMLASCSKEDNGEEGNNGKDFSFLLKIDAAKLGSPTSRIEEPGLKDDNTSITTVSSLVIYYLDGAAGNVVATKVLETKEDIDKATDGTGLIMSGIKSSASHVYVVANYTENGVALVAEGTTLADIKNAVVTMDIRSENSTTDWTKALLSPVGDGVKIDKTDKEGTPEKPFTVAVTILPALSRLEIAQVSINTDLKILPERTAETFEFAGIAINGCYSEFTVGGGTSGTKHVWNKTPAHDYTGIPDWCSDKFKDVKKDAAFYKPTVGTNVWAYMLPAGETPRIVLSIPSISFKDVTPAVTTNPWLTVKKMKNDGTSEYINTFARGYFYKISNILFDASNVRDTPNPEDVSVEVKVTVTAWQGINATPEF